MSSKNAVEIDLSEKPNFDEYMGDNYSPFGEVLKMMEKREFSEAHDEFDAIVASMSDDPDDEKYKYNIITVTQHLLVFVEEELISPTEANKAYNLFYMRDGTFFLF
tara:strand:- start:1019 stop:1336 length:318 start_codon:yes stop_codon:yes gene_type:complete